MFFNRQNVSHTPVTYRKTQAIFSILMALKSVPITQIFNACLSFFKKSTNWYSSEFAFFPSEEVSALGHKKYRRSDIQNEYEAIFIEIKLPSQTYHFLSDFCLVLILNITAMAETFITSLLTYVESEPVYFLLVGIF